MAFSVKLKFHLWLDLPRNFQFSNGSHMQTTLDVKEKQVIVHVLYKERWKTRL